MRKPKSKSKQLADHKRATKRSKRFRESRKKVAAKRAVELLKRKVEKLKFLNFIKKIQEARRKGEI